MKAGWAATAEVMAEKAGWAAAVGVVAEKAGWTAAMEKAAGLVVEEKAAVEAADFLRWRIRWCWRI